MADFPDVNVWVALSAPEHPFYQAVRRYFEGEAGRDLVFCWITAIGLVRVTSRPHSFGGKPLSPVEAWQNYCRWRARDDVSLAGEPGGIDTYISAWVAEGRATASNWTDLYLAAFACGHGMRLVSFDRGFTRLPGLDVLVLEQGSDDH